MFWVYKRVVVDMYGGIEEFEIKNLVGCPSCLTGGVVNPRGSTTSQHFTSFFFSFFSFFER